MQANDNGQLYATKVTRGPRRCNIAGVRKYDEAFRSSKFHTLESNALLNEGS